MCIYFRTDSGTEELEVDAISEGEEEYDISPEDQGIARLKLALVQT